MDYKCDTEEDCMALMRLADSLDRLGYTKEADEIDAVLEGWKGTEEYRIEHKAW